MFTITCVIMEIEGEKNHLDQLKNKSDHDLWQLESIDVESI